MPDGKGTIKWKAGTEYAVYEGDVRNNMPEGQGTYRWPDGRSYQGSFINGAFGGHGVLRDKNGKVEYDGEWVNGRPAKKAE